MKLLPIIAVLLILPAVSAFECDEAYEGMIITENKTLCSDTFEVRGGILIADDDVILNCRTGILMGDGHKQGIRIENATNVTVKNCNIINYNVGIYLKNATYSYIYDNGLLKNYVGIRLFNSYENRIENNADKSHTKAVSAIASKFNNVWLTNKNIEKGFCDFNLCNEAGEMNPCLNDDFYCSPKCTWETDNDCENPNKPVINETKGPTKAELLIAEAERELAETIEEEEAEKEKQDSWVNWKIQLLVYLGIYIIGFIIVQRYQFSHPKRKK